MPDSVAKAVVIVEDDPSMCRALRRILRLGGFATTAYASAEALLAREDPLVGSCLVVDVKLPGMNGFTLHRRLVARGSVPPIVFITAFDEGESAAQAAKIRPSALLIKPFTGRALLQTIDGLLNPQRREGTFDA